MGFIADPEGNCQLFLQTETPSCYGAQQNESDNIDGDKINRAGSCPSRDRNHKRSCVLGNEVTLCVLLVLHKC